MSEYPSWIEAVDEGIREFVLFLWELGYETTDSGDGSKYPEMECALPYANVFGRVPDDRDIKEFSRELLRVSRRFGYEDPLVEINYSPNDDLCVFCVCPTGTPT